MNAPTYELVDKGNCWAAVRDGSAVFATWDRDQDPTEGRLGLLEQMSVVVAYHWGRQPRWVPTGTGWRAT